MRTSYALAIFIVVLAGLGYLFFLTGKNPFGSPGPAHPQTVTKTGPVTSKKVKLLGSGATFPYPQLAAWLDDFHKKHPDITISYNPIGSGAGQKQFFSRLVDFAGTDPPVTRAKWQEWNGKFVQIPYLLGGVVITYNLPELSGHELKLDAETIALIFKAEIKYWDDPRISSLNPGVKLPHKKIIAVHRSDSSGTTNIFTFFLHKAAPNVWPKSLVGKTIEWPVDGAGNGLGGKGNQGVAQIILSTEYSIGYVELAYALESKMPVALIKNREGKFVRPTTETTTAAAVGALSSLPKTPLDDFSEDLNAVIFAPGENAYPLTAFTHLLFYTKYDDPDKLRAIKEFIKYVNTEGQDKIVPGYAPIPEELRKINLKALEIIEGP